MSAPELVIFDCDGVLVDSERLANEVLAEALRRYGLDMSVDESMATFVGLSMTAVVEKANALIGRPLPEDFLDGVQKDTFAAFKGRVKAVPGVRDLVEAVQAAGIKTCIASSGGFDKMAVTLGETGLAPLFEGRIFSSSQVKRGKPYPDLFLFAAEQMGTQPEHCVVVEDSRYGAEAARRAGMTALAYVPNGDAASFEGENTYIIKEMSEARKLIGV
ncbi:MAG: HAD family phosphatase [Sphingomonadales bacterium]|jgi:HAD superfamily hydrolase (TIGR01509 family)